MEGKTWKTWKRIQESIGSAKERSRLSIIGQITDK